jgi:hypothetical protein
MTYDAETALREGVPAYAAAVAALEHLEKVEVPAGDHGTPLSVTISWLQGEVDAGRRVSGEKLLKRAVEAATEDEARDAATGALNYVKTMVASTRDSLRDQNRDVVLKAMAVELAEIVGELRELMPLAQVTDALAAINAGRSDDHKRFLAVAEAYERLRADQIKLTREALGRAEPTHPLALVVHDPLAVMPEYASWHAKGPQVAPWPIEPPRAVDVGIWRTVRTGRDTVLVDASRREFAVWAIESGIELALPTMDQYHAAVERLTEHLTGPDPAGFNGKVDRGVIVMESGTITLGADR